MTSWYAHIARITVGAIIVEGCAVGWMNCSFVVQTRVMMQNQPVPKFAPAAFADSEGMVLVGGQLDSHWLVAAYSQGIFPWPSCDGQLAWFSPDPRGILELEEFRISQRLRRRLRSGKFSVTRDQAFDQVVEGCATVQDRARFTWISPAIRTAYRELHRLGLAHSVEAWRDGQLVGGIYGVTLGGLFAGESMFYRETDASKVALAFLVEHLRQRQFRLFDLQIVTPHTYSLGAKLIPRSLYLRRLREALSLEVNFT
jgi:leucyl/phenylalanyl-tRNA---protein transferase